MSNIAKAPPYILFFLFALSQSTETVFTTGLPHIASEFSVAPSLAQLCSSIYFFGFACGIFSLGTLSDRIGRKPVLLGGLSIYLLSSILSFYAPSIYHLIILRFCQAFGASVGSVIAQAIARDSYKGNALSLLYANLAAGLAIMPSLGSFIGGNIVEYFGWRYNFIYLFISIGIVCIASFFRMPETNSNIGLVERNFFKVLIKVAQDKKVLCYGGIIGCFNGIMYSFYIEAPFIFITKIGIHPSKYGFIILLLSFAGMIGSILSKNLQAKITDGNIIIKRGIIVSICSCFLFVTLAFLWAYDYISTETAGFVIIIPMLFQAACFSIVMPLVLRYSLEDYNAVNGTAGSLFGSYYYCLIASVNFITTRIHSSNIKNISIFFLILSALSYLLFYISNHREN